MTARQHVVFLQGMPSAFFTRMAAELEQIGIPATGFNFCTGDRIFCRAARVVNYRGKFSDWPDYISFFFKEKNVTDLVVLGDQRGYHKQAVEVARAENVRVHVLDFGHVRPGFLTLEQGGKNEHSFFPKTREGLRALAAASPAPDLAPLYKDNFWTMARGDMVYHFANIFFGWLYPRYKKVDRRQHPFIYYPAMGLRLLQEKRFKKDGDKKIAALAKAKTRYFVFPLQLDHDFQIISYSPFGNLAAGIDVILKSFAAHADQKTHLAVKVHPWDPCLKNWKRFVKKRARALGIAAHVYYFDGGDLDEMVKHCAGMVTVNSTSGISALQAAKPVVTLGNVIYNIPGLTHQDTLDRFWSAPQAPEKDLVYDLIKAIVAATQIKGGFFSEPGLSAGARATALKVRDAAGDAVVLSAA